MKLYRLPLVLHEPSEDTEDKYLSEVPDLPGCRAWGDNAAQALENLQILAAAFINRTKTEEIPCPSRCRPQFPKRLSHECSVRYWSQFDLSGPDPQTAPVGL